ncbi:MAG TPA: hypothetical protein VN282_10040 [Pyrinomonadaceae bacterium]|nr:hypothetical protein [Pyrinomonadaceae bacterium]
MFTVCRVKVCVLAALAAVAALSAGAGAQTAPPRELTATERALVEGSREAIIKTGVSPTFFDKHFRVQSVVDRPGDRRVVWRLSVGGYEASVKDSVGFYTEGARRVDTHSVAATLGETGDITRTITRRRAESLMRRCIGRFTGPQVEYRAHGAGGRAALLLTAHSLVPRRREARARSELEERGRRERARAGGSQTTDEIGEEDEGGGGPVVVLGAVDLVTGECTVGYGQAGPRPPEPARPPGRQR